MNKITSFYVLDDEIYVNEVQYVATRAELDQQWEEYKQEFSLPEEQKDDFIQSWDEIAYEEFIANHEEYTRAAANNEIFDTRIIDFINDSMQTYHDLTQIVTAAEAAEMMNLSESAVRVAINRGQIHARKSGGTWLLRKSDVFKKWDEITNE